MRKTFVLLKLKKMEEKKYSNIEEEDGYGALTATEPAVTLTTSSYLHIHKQESFNYPDNYDPGIGPHSMEELNARIDKTEQDINDPDKWILVDDFWDSMREEHLWLR